ncbi:MAG: glycosyltransferase family 2 protein [Myxococcota bacterium]|jgi:N-acetylglucosaminyl-diphospho-decaprenol L-rhamnosyltransferase|nr:glycosyltransferase family 2 protein [Myxococcota bacterium]
MKILTIILNYKTPDMTLESIDAAWRELARYPDAEIVVVDNDSQDGSFKKLCSAVKERDFDGRVRVVASDYNGGFAYGNNFAIAPALAGDDLPDYVYLLNSDAFPDNDCIGKLVEYLDANPKVGIAGSYVHGPEPVPHKTAFQFHSIYSELESTLGLGLVSKLLKQHIVALPLPTESRQVDWLAGASMLIRRQVLEDIGLMDDSFFLYFEETDFCYRARQAGWTTHYVVESSVTHVGSVSTGMKDKAKPTPTYWFASRRHYFLKNKGRLYLWGANLAYVIGGTLRRIVWRTVGRPEFDAKHHLRDFIRFNFRLGKTPDGHPHRLVS